jgi:hypothetical protein
MGGGVAGFIVGGGGVELLGMFKGFLEIPFALEEMHEFVVVGLAGLLGGIDMPQGGFRVFLDGSGVTLGLGGLVGPSEGFLGMAIGQSPAANH